MELGMIGLGRMGDNMTRRLLNGGHRVMVYDSTEKAVEAIVRQGAIGATSFANLSAKLTRPHAV